MKLMVILSVALVGAVVSAAIPGKQNPLCSDPEPEEESLHERGVFTGGKAGTGATVLGVRRTYSAKINVERVIVDLDVHKTDT